MKANKLQGTKPCSYWIGLALGIKLISTQINSVADNSNGLQLREHYALQEGFWLVFFNNLSLIHKDNTVCNLLSKTHLMGYTKHSDALFG
jgi:hypothetical protein